MSFLVLVVDDEPDVEMLFRQQFRRDLRDNRFRMDFAQSAAALFNVIGDAAGESLILILSDINMPGMSGLELLDLHHLLLAGLPGALRFTPESRHYAAHSVCPFRATNGLMHCSKTSSRGRHVRTHYSLWT